MRRARMIVLVVAAVAAGPADAFPATSTGRVFTVAPWPAGRVVVAPDGTVYGVDDELTGAILRRLRPGDTTPQVLHVPATPAHIAVAPGGALLWSDLDTGRVWRREASGGQTPLTPETPRMCPTAIAATPSGGVVVMDGARAVRLVEPGAAPRVLWAADDVARDTFCPSLTSSSVDDVAAAPDGAIYALVSGTLWRLSADAPAVKLFTTRDASSVSVALDGSLVLTTQASVVRRRLGAARTTTVMSFYDADVPDESAFDGDGRLATRFGAAVSLHGAAAATPDGGVIIPVETMAGDPAERLVYVAPPRPARLGVALDGRAGRVGGRRYIAAVRLTRAARVRVVLRDVRKRIVASRTLHLRAGVTPVPLRARRSFGAYVVTATATSAGARAVDTVRVGIGSLLPMAKVRRLVPASVDLAGCGIRTASGTAGAPVARAADCSSDDVPTTTGVCRRWAALRGDCAFSWRDHDGARSCAVVASRLTPFGTLITGDSQIRCPARGAVAPRSPRDVDLSLEGPAGESVP